MSFIYPPNFIAIVEHFLLILSQKSKNIKNRAKSHPFFYWPLYIFTFQKWKGQFWKKSFFGELGDLKIFRSEKVNHRNLREISAKFHRDFIEISLVASQKRRKKENFFTCLRPFFEKLASTLTASISAPLQDRNFKFCMFT